MFGDVGRTRYDINFTLFGISVRIHPLFWLFAILFSPFLGSRIEEGEMPLRLLGLLGWMLAWGAVFLVHEFGHALVIQRIYGARPWIIFYGFGGLTCHQPYYRKSPGPWGRVLISMAGPGAGFLVAFLILLLTLLSGCHLILSLNGLGILPIPLLFPYEILLQLENPSNLFFYLVGWFVFGFLWMSVFWGILNLLPIYPLDGGNIARELLVMMDPRQGLVNSLWISIIVAGILAVFCVKEGSVFAGMFFGFIAWQCYQQIQHYQNR